VVSSWVVVVFWIVVAGGGVGGGGGGEEHPGDARARRPRAKPLKRRFFFIVSM
jgi:hypothetical protein